MSGFHPNYFFVNIFREIPSSTLNLDYSEFNIPQARKDPPLRTESVLPPSSNNYQKSDFIVDAGPPRHKRYQSVDYTPQDPNYYDYKPQKIVEPYPAEPFIPYSLPESQPYSQQYSSPSPPPTPAPYHHSSPAPYHHQEHYSPTSSPYHHKEPYHHEDPYHNEEPYHPTPAPYHQQEHYPPTPEPEYFKNPLPAFLPPPENYVHEEPDYKTHDYYNYDQYNNDYHSPSYKSYELDTFTPNDYNDHYIDIPKLGPGGEALFDTDINAPGNYNQFVNVAAPESYEHGHVRGNPEHKLSLIHI